ncbi:hypothetical protein [Gracilibacillus caseinilyticus]|nr:hypothetical protein [Gracilibacillus caseinilyticus]
MQRKKQFNKNGILIQKERPPKRVQSKEAEKEEAHYRKDGNR